MKIAVLFGGKSEERDVSIASGSQVVKALREAGHEVLAVDTAQGLLSAESEKQLLTAGVAELPPDHDELTLMSSDASPFAQSPELQNIDTIFLVLHGGSGEDGTIQAYLDLAGIPYTGSGHLGSACAMDKDISKRLFKLANIPTPEWIMAPADPEIVAQQLGYPVVVKPNQQGSTIGLTVVKDPKELESAVNYAFQFDKEVMLERFIPGRELTVGILNDKPLSTGEIIPNLSDIFDYQSKYQKGGATEIFPADITPAQDERVKELALMAHQTLKLEGFSRVDFRMDADGEFWCLEANTLPGMTETSLLPQSAQAVGINFPELCERISQLAIDRHKQKRR
jgi:D-alanine-D-alanine ligase